jgi:transcriptional regulator with XRE-family HTH domain
MLIADRICALREQKNLSQGDIEDRTGLRRCYISRVENGHIVPAIETLEKIARGLEVPLYQLFYEGEEPPMPSDLLERKAGDDVTRGAKGKDARLLPRLRSLLGHMEEYDRQLLLALVRKMASRYTSRLPRSKTTAA